MVDGLTDEPVDSDARLTRLRENKPLRVVDLFAGCGGMSLGLQRAGYTLLGGIEIDAGAVRTYAHNFFRNADEDVRERHSIPYDIMHISPDVYMHTVLQAEHPENLVDVIVGGPPCQAFSRIGLAKLRSLNMGREHPAEDERASLYLHYLQYVAFFRPLAIIMENVPDMLSYNGQNVAEAMAQTLEEMGYRCRYTILNAAFYGVPQLRQRLYLIAFLETLGVEPTFPLPSHFMELPPNYGAVRVPDVDAPLFSERRSHYIPPRDPDASLPAACTVKDALADLPPLSDPMELAPNERYRDRPLNYREDVALSSYAQEMREWPEFEAIDRIHHHITRCLPRDAPIFARMQPGDQYPQAHAVALRLFEEALDQYQKAHHVVLDETTEMYHRLRKQIVPPYSPEKFPNKWWKLIPEKPSRTLTAHMSKDTYTHIHYDSMQARVISVREAARLQSFPDGFQFSEAMGSTYRQIGNAVPPLQSYALAVHVQEALLRVARAIPEVSSV